MPTTKETQQTLKLDRTTTQAQPMPDPQQLPFRNAVSVPPARRSNYRPLSRATRSLGLQRVREIRAELHHDD